MITNFRKEPIAADQRNPTWKEVFDTVYLSPRGCQPYAASFLRTQDGDGSIDIKGKKVKLRKAQYIRCALQT